MQTPATHQNFMMKKYSEMKKSLLTNRKAISPILYSFFPSFLLVVYIQKGTIIPMLTQIFLLVSFIRIFTTFLGYADGWHFKLEVT